MEWILRGEGHKVISNNLILISLIRLLKRLIGHLSVHQKSINEVIITIKKQVMNTLIQYLGKKSRLHKHLSSKDQRSFKLK